MITVGLVKDRQDFLRMLHPFSLGDGPFIIKPNWHNDTKGYYTDPRTLELLLQVLPPGKKYVIEAHSYARNDRSRLVQPHEGIEHWAWLHEQERAYLEVTGLAKVLKKHEVEYINVTDEVWAGRTVEAETIERLVTPRYGQVTRKELLATVPRKLFDLRPKATFINFAKLKAWVGPNGRSYSLALKNVFGLIPSPNRHGYHGASVFGLPRSIVEINMIYHTLFPVLSICEAVYNTLVTVPFQLLDGSGLVENLGLVAVSDRAVDLDAFLVHAIDGQPSQRHFLMEGVRVFGDWHQEEFPVLSAPVKEAVERLRHLIMSPGSS